MGVFKITIIEFSDHCVIVDVKLEYLSVFEEEFIKSMRSFVWISKYCDCGCVKILWLVVLKLQKTKSVLLFYFLS